MTPRDPGPSSRGSNLWAAAPTMRSARASLRRLRRPRGEGAREELGRRGRAPVDEQRERESVHRIAPCARGAALVTNPRRRGGYDLAALQEITRELVRVDEPLGCCWR